MDPRLENAMLIGILGNMRQNEEFEPVNGSTIDTKGNDIKTKA